MNGAAAAAFLDEMAHLPLLPLGEWIQLAIAGAPDDRLLGDIGLCVTADGEQAELGFTLSPSAQGKGLATAAVQAAVDFVFDSPRVRQIYAITDSRNLPSIRLLERLAFRRADSFVAEFRGEQCIELVYTLTRDSVPAR
jgi:RimJ/RimL family protein N-acetyltransferase